MKPIILYQVKFGLIDYATENRILRPVALYLTLKLKYRNTIIYNYNPHKVSKLTGVSHKTVKRYINRLIEHKFVYINDSGHLVLRKQSKVKQDVTGEWKGIRKLLVLEKNRIDIKFSDVLLKVKYLVIKTDSVRQRYAREKSLKKLKGLTSREVKLNEQALKPRISTRQLARLFKTSPNTARSWLHSLEAQGLIHVKQHICKIGKVSPKVKIYEKQLMEDFDGFISSVFCFSFKGELFAHFGLELSFQRP